MFLDGSNLARFNSGRFEVKPLLEVLRYLKSKKEAWNIEAIRIFLPQIYFSRSTLEFNVKLQKVQKDNKKLWCYPQTKSEIDLLLKAIEQEPTTFVKCPSGDIDDYYVIDRAFCWE